MKKENEIITSAKSAPYLGPTVRKAIQRAENIDHIYDIVNGYVKILEVVNNPAEPPEKIEQALRDKLRWMRDEGKIPKSPSFPESKDLRAWLGWIQQIRLGTETKTAERKRKPKKPQRCWVLAKQAYDDAITHKAASGFTWQQGDDLYQYWEYYKENLEDKSVYRLPEHKTWKSYLQKFHKAEKKQQEYRDASGSDGLKKD